MLTIWTELFNSWAKLLTSEQHKVFSVYDDNIFPFFREFNVFSVDNFQMLFQILGVTKNVTHDKTRR